MKLKNKIILTILFLLLITIFNIRESWAAISASSKTVNSGETVSILITSGVPVVSYKVSMTSNGGLTFVNSSGGTGAGTTTITDASSSGMTSLATYTFKTPEVSSDTRYTVSFSASAMEDENFNTVANSTTSATITVKAVPKPTSDAKDPVVGQTPAKNPTNTTKPTPKPAAEQEKKSNDATLDSLLIEEGTFTPEFSKDVKEYSMEVENSVTELNVTANLSDFKAAVTIDGNKELKVGENIVTIKVVAEDGTVTEYIVKVNRKRENLALNSLKIYYLDENNETQEIYFTPEFSKEVLEYSVDNLSYLINSLKFDAVPNIEGAVVEITGNENLKEGENVITIKITLPAQNEGEEDEVLVYTVKVNKEPKPVLTLMGRIKNWFGGIGSAISSWYKNNQYMIIISSLSLCSACMVGLTVYLIIDYKKYKVLLAKVAEITKSNNTNDILVQETNAYQLDNEEELDSTYDEGIQEKQIKNKGRHF